MFFADFVLFKKGELGRIWLAAHWDKKLTKNQIFNTDIEALIGEKHFALLVSRAHHTRHTSEPRSSDSDACAPQAREL
jgi:hypothetical protein